MKLNLFKISFLFLIPLTSHCFGSMNKNKKKKKFEYSLSQNKYLNNIADTKIQINAHQIAQALIDTYCIETSTLKFRDIKKSIGAICKIYHDIICRHKASSHRIYTLKEKNAKTAEIAPHDDTDEFKFQVINKFLFNLILVGSRLSEDSVTMTTPIKKNNNKKNG